MILNLKVDVSGQKIARIITNLRKLSSGAFVKAINMQPYADRALSNLKEHFPQSRRGSISSINEFGAPLVDGWKALPQIQALSVGFALAHDKQADPRVATVLSVLDTGSRAYSFAMPETVHFIDTRPGSFNKKSGLFPWVTIGEGQKVKHEERLGTDYTGKTYEFITQVLVPEIRAEVIAKAREVADA